MSSALRELVVISGKGGTGKTSVTASLAVLAGSAVLADADVDAADLHLVLAPRTVETHAFISGHEAVIRAEDCTRCGRCADLCRFGAVQASDAAFRIDPAACEGCGVCVRFCPARAIDFPDRRCGEWMVSETRVGPMVHARLSAAGENSGKLVSVVRRKARRLAEISGRDLILVDGPPGIGCAVIASLTGVTEVLVVTEPTVSGEHDLERVLKLTRHFDLPVSVCVNKWDLNPGTAERIERLATRLGARPAGRIPMDPDVTRAQVEGRTVVETGGPAADDIRRLWRTLTSN